MHRVRDSEIQMDATDKCDLRYDRRPREIIDLLPSEVFRIPRSFRISNRDESFPSISASTVEGRYVICQNAANLKRGESIPPPPPLSAVQQTCITFSIWFRDEVNYIHTYRKWRITQRIAYNRKADRNWPLITLLKAVARNPWKNVVNKMTRMESNYDGD